MATRAGKVMIGIFGGATLGFGIGGIYNLSFLGGPIGAILLTGILLEIDNRNNN